MSAPRQVMVRYRVKQDCAVDNERYIRAVFDELARTSPPGLEYASFKMEDGVSFVHLATVTTDDGANPLSALAAFQAFTKDIRDRCEEPPLATPLHAIGAYRDPAKGAPDNREA